MIDQFCKKKITYLLSPSVLSTPGCGGGSSSESGNRFSPTSQAIGGSGVKGRLAHAKVSVLKPDSTQSGFKSSPVATATTNEAAAITGLALPFPSEPPYLIKFKSNGATTDLTTGQFPVIPTQRSVITTNKPTSGKQVHAQPLTTMVVEMAIANANPSDAPFTGNGDSQASSAEFLAALPVALNQLSSIREN